jgi:DNA (cytosine-5)-methyltransferase 1
MKVGSLFAGIGGIDLGLERAGFEVIWQVEKDQFCRDVLAKHWPTTPRHVLVEDVGAHNLEECDVICGGFPCQDISTANPDGLGLGG